MSDKPLSSKLACLDFGDLGLLDGAFERGSDIVTRTAGVIRQAPDAFLCVLEDERVSVFMRSQFLTRDSDLLADRYAQENSMFAGNVERGAGVRIADLNKLPEFEAVFERPCRHLNACSPTLYLAPRATNWCADRGEQRTSQMGRD